MHYHYALVTGYRSVINLPINHYLSAVSAQNHKSSLRNAGVQTLSVALPLLFLYVDERLFYVVRRSKYELVFQLFFQ